MADNWEVPTFKASEFRGKFHKHALVIPVINEGERIRVELYRLQELAMPVDIVIADGGSTDGSVEADFLSAVGVRALLVKLGAGKLSAQLRMAYAWCLREGYEGIVTVDGNGKDDLEAISLFLEGLVEGYGLVQGSRFLRGGKAINTPLDRYLANRLLHAPLISLRARHIYTDTTNGFRGYSASLLADPRVAPFRAAFDRYSLLFYLSVIAPRLGYRVKEVPVTRRYPKNAPTPTKVSGFRGRWLMLWDLFAVLSGRLDVNSAPLGH